MSFGARVAVCGCKQILQKTKHFKVFSAIELNLNLD